MAERRLFAGFGLVVFICLALGLVLSNLLLYYLTNLGIGNSYYDALVVLNMAKRSTLRVTLTVNVLVYAGVLMLVFISSLIMTHRISGPMYRIEKTADMLAEGDLTVAPLVRDKDHLKPQCQEFGLAIDEMRSRLAEVKRCVDALRRRGDFFAGFMHSGDPDADEVKTLLDDMRALSGEITGGLSHFKTGGARTGGEQR